ncbi:MAG: hypothetical protein OIF40_06190 [Mangrovicoccus sp.]|nr:hypothetical protein [Mangrovicoccus sp.]
MDLALRAVKYKIWLKLVECALILALILIGEGYSGFALTILLLYLGIIGTLYLVHIGLRRGLPWVAVFLALICLLDFFITTVGGVGFRSVISMIDAVLSFVAICGVFIWLRERSIARQTARSVADPPA